MALQKAKVLPNGSEGNYWKIISILAEKPSHNVTYIIALFKDKAIADAKMPSLGLGKKYVFHFTFEQLKSDLIALGYAGIKAKAASLIDQLGLDGKPTGDQVPYDPDLIDTEDV